MESHSSHVARETVLGCLGLYALLLRQVTKAPLSLFGALPWQVPVPVAGSRPWSRRPAGDRLPHRPQHHL